jgi:hypothetical protein
MLITANQTTNGAEMMPHTFLVAFPAVNGCLEIKPCLRNSQKLRHAAVSICVTRLVQKPLRCCVQSLDIQFFYIIIVSHSIDKQDGVSVIIEIGMGRFVPRACCMSDNDNPFSADLTANSTEMEFPTFRIAFLAVNVSLQITPNLRMLQR